MKFRLNNTFSIISPLPKIAWINSSGADPDSYKWGLKMPVNNTIGILFFLTIIDSHYQYEFALGELAKKRYVFGLASSATCLKADGCYKIAPKIKVHTAGKNKNPPVFKVLNFVSNQHNQTLAAVSNSPLII